MNQNLGGWQKVQGSMITYTSFVVDDQQIFTIDAKSIPLLNGVFWVCQINSVTSLLKLVF